MDKAGNFFIMPWEREGDISGHSVGERAGAKNVELENVTID